MPLLAEIQRSVRHAVVTGDAAAVAPLLVGGRNVGARLNIHHRHYRASLTEALSGKFPATAWLVGDGFVHEAAAAFLEEHPPRAICVAEYGEGFPGFLGRRPAAAGIEYLASFAKLEWHLGQVSLAVDAPALTLATLAEFDGAVLADAAVVLQSGVRYLEAHWPVDSLLTMFLTDTAPDHLELVPEQVSLEIRGARGQFTMTRLSRDAFTFRRALHGGRTLGESAELALDASDAFDPASALGALVSDGLLTALAPTIQGRETT